MQSCGFCHRKERGAVLQLDGNNSYVDCGDNWMFNITGSITVSAWIKVNRFGENYDTIISRGGSSWRLLRHGGENSVEFASSGLTNNYWGSVYGHSNINDGQWHHITGVYDGKEIPLYVDGTLDVSEEATGYITLDDAPVFIGSDQYYDNRNWNGLIDHVRVYSYALSVEEISELYQSESTKTK